MKPWHQVVVPHKDIRQGKFDESVFAADLADVVADRGPLEYRDPITFFQKTYPTRGLANLLSVVLLRLSGKGGGEGVIQIQTPFGGGKTHSLIALYHLFRHGKELVLSANVKDVLDKAGVQAVPDTKVAVFVGTAADAIRGKTPWGELADQLGAYAQLEDHDRRRRTPGKDMLHKLLGDRPTLILMDEIAEYAVKAKDYSDQVLAFFQELTETVKVLPQCALVVTLPSSAPYGEEGERVLDQLQRIFGRVEAIYSPVEGEEVYEVIRRRLFEEEPDRSEAWRVAEEYWQMYQDLGDDVPREAREPVYREKLHKAYPFHPELLDVLYERWSTFPTFQRTRGVLRLLAQVVADLYRREHPAPLIQSAHLNLADASIRREFLKHIGNEYEGVIASDIADGNARAQRVDKEMGSEYIRFGIASGLATAIFFGSFSGGERRGVGIQRLRLGILREGIPPALVGDALHRLEGELWYLHVEGGLYMFSSQPNLNRIIVEREEAVKPEQIEEEIKARLEKVAGSELQVRLWPATSQDIPDSKELKLVVLTPEQSQGGAAAGFAEEMLNKCGQTPRTYRNTLLVLAAESSEFATLRSKVRRFLALRSIKDDKPLTRQLSEKDKTDLESKLKELDEDIPFKVLSVYRRLGKLGEQGVEWFSLGIPVVGERASLAKRVLDYLRGKDLLPDRISAKWLLEKTLKADEAEKPVDDVIEAFWRYPHLPMVRGREVAIAAIRQGVIDGVFGVRSGGNVYFKEPVDDGALDYGAVIVREPAESEPSEPVGEKEPIAGAVRETGPGPVGSDAIGFTAQATGLSKYSLRAQIPWDKLSDFVRGVVIPLQQDGAQLTVEISLEARAGSGPIKETTLAHKVGETLRQIGAKVEEESKE